ncbi:NRF domain-containing protein [Aphelenchoides fujianensis]|nr:NRF domain-containing protein [Aphelenchoides fujianensis]
MTDVREHPPAGRPQDGRASGAPNSDRSFGSFAPAGGRLISRPPLGVFASLPLDLIEWNFVCILGIAFRLHRTEIRKHAAASFRSPLLPQAAVRSEPPLEIKLSSEELLEAAQWPADEDPEMAKDLGNFYANFFHDSRTSITLDLDMFREIYDEISRYRAAAQDGQTDVLEAAVEFFAPLQKYDVSAPCLADIFHLLYSTYSYAATSVKSRQCDNCNCTLGYNEEFSKYRWIFNVLDSIGKVPSAILGGNNLWTGSWTVCRNVAVVKNHQGQQWRGQYCMARFHAYNRNNPVKAFMSPPEDPAAFCFQNGSSANESWSEDDLKCFDLMPLAERRRVHSGHLHHARLYSAAEMAFGRPLVCDVTVQCSNESPEQNLSHHTSSILFSLFLLVILTLLIFGTSYDLYVERPLHEHLVRKAKRRAYEQEYEGLIGSPTRSERVYEMSLEDLSDYKRSAFATTLMMFSISRNLRYIMETKTEDGQIRCLHGARFLSMCWIVFGHTYYYVCATLTTDNLLQTMREFPKSFYNQIVVQAPLAVDSFFFLSGLLTSYIFLGKIRKNQVRLGAWTTWFAYFVRRYIRLTPVYAVVMLLMLTMFSFISEALVLCGLLVDELPLPKQLPQAGRSLHGLDVFYTFLPLLILALHRLRIGGVLIGVGLCVLSSVVTLWITIIRSYPPAPLLTTKLQIVTILNDYWVDLYVKPYCRMSPYIIGCLTGYLLLEKHRSIFKLNPVQWAVGWVLAAGCGLYAVFGLFWYTKSGEITALHAAIYTLVGRPCFAVFLSWIVFVCEANPTGKVNAILGHRVFVPLSKITFCAYLIHPILLQTFYLSRPSAFHFTNSFQMIHMFLIALAGSYAAALVLSLAFELPVMHLDKLLFQPPPKRPEAPPTANGQELDEVRPNSRLKADETEGGAPATDQQEPLVQPERNGTERKAAEELASIDRMSGRTAHSFSFACCL